jgi:hypothetical protein
MALLLGGMTMTIALFFIVSALIGLVLGITQKGITINIVHKSVDTVDKPKEYNQSMVDLLDPEVKNYYHNTNGKNHF